MAGGKMKNMISLKDQEVNVGRQRELDLVKGFLMIMIVFIHSFQTIAGAEAAESSVHNYVCVVHADRCLPVSVYYGIWKCFYKTFPA